MTVWQELLIFAAGTAAGMINVIVGSGTLITFPVLLGVGMSPVVANVTNTVGLVPGSVSGAIGYRDELGGQRSRAIRLGIAATLGAIVGAVALLALPASAFKDIVPVFIVIALVLIVLQPMLTRRLVQRPRPTSGKEGAGILAYVFATGIYGGYFGAAQGILLIAFLGIVLPEPLQRVNALKNVLAGTVNAVSGLIFCFVADVDWKVAAIIAVGATIGGQLGARYGRKLPPVALRGVIIVVGITALIHLLA